MNRLVCSLLVAAIFLSSCSVLDSGVGSPKLYGEWKWVQSTGGFGGWTLAPDSADVPERTLLFRKDHSLLHFQDDTIAHRGSYSFYKNHGEIIISYEGFEDTGGGIFLDQRVRFQSEDTLHLMDECFDCYIHMYARIR